MPVSIQYVEVHANTDTCTNPQVFCHSFASSTRFDNFTARVNSGAGEPMPQKKK